MRQELVQGKNEFQFLKESEIPGPKNFVVMLAGPSGVGKGTIINELLDNNSLDLKKVVRYTTRQKGSKEQDHIDYHFISQTQFQELQDKGEIFESSSYGKELQTYYGTSFKSIKEICENGKTPLFDIDINTALILKEKLESRGITCLDIFISPVGPIDLFQGIEKAVEVLEQRLEDRRRDTDKDITGRTKRARMYLTQTNELNYFVPNKNGNLRSAVSEVETYIREYKDLFSNNSLYNFRQLSY